MATLLPNLEQAHDAIVDASTKEAPGLRRVSEAQAIVDDKHDAYVRCIYGTLSMLALVSEKKDAILALRDTLFPRGLGHVRASYRGESGHATLVASQLDDALKARLQAIVMGDKTLLDMVLAWIATSKELGQLEDERSLLSASSGVGTDIKQARQQWIRVAKALMTVARIAEVDQDTDNVLFAPLRDRERAAESRIHYRADAPVPAPNPAGPTSPTGSAPAVS